MLHLFNVQKFFSAILILLYCSTTTGATLQMHYCMGDLVERNFFHNETEPCSNCGMEKEKSEESGCCKNENEFVKADHFQLAPDASFSILQSLSLPISISYIDVPVAFSSITEENPTSNAPPDKAGIAIYKRNCVYRI